MERTLLDVPGIAEARVFGMACPTLEGRKSSPFSSGPSRSLDTDRHSSAQCAVTLSAHKIPRRFVFVDRFPVDARGKLDRQALQQLASRASGEQ